MLWLWTSKTIAAILVRCLGDVQRESQKQAKLTAGTHKFPSVLSKVITAKE